MTKTCVIVSPYFPPSSLAGVHRARYLAKHLAAEGWGPIVLCVDEAYHEGQPDVGLAKLVPRGIEVVKVSALPVWLTRPVGLGEISLRAFLSLRRALFALLRTRSVSAVLITGSPYYPMVFTAAIRRRFDVPVVLDFQDPWVSTWGAKQPRFSKAGLSHTLAQLLEPRALRHASWITAVSDKQNAQMVERYPWVDRERMTAIPIGYDKDDFQAVASAVETVAFPSDSVRVSYVGTIWPAVKPTLRAILRAAAILRDQSPELYKRLRLNFVGTNGTSDGTVDFRVMPSAEAEGVADIVSERPERIPYLEALALLTESHASLMLGSDEPHYTASKIYPYLMSGRPYLAVFHRASSAHGILSAAGGGIVLSFESQRDLTALGGAICDGLRKLMTEPQTLGTAYPAAYQPYEARNIAHQYANIFDRLMRERESS